MDELKRRDGAERLGFGVHLVLLGWIALVIVVGFLQHRAIAELWEQAAGGAARVRLEALQALAQRAGPEELARRYPAALLETDEARLREFAFTNTFTRSPLTSPAEADLMRLVDPAERFRAALWLECRMTTPRRITRADLDTWFDEAHRPRD